ncbi:MAG: HAMP domain-containing protein [Marinilabiliaceae bacterium]|nr:HAMP domain-containing protein [Marinilabiliaceae bacterium]
MNFNDLKLGSKLSIGFGVLLLIAFVLAGMAIFNMSNIATKAKSLTEEYVPEVKFAVDLRGAANRTMYQMRGYGLTSEDEYYRNALREIDAIKRALADGEELNNNSVNLVKLADELKVTNEVVSKYISLMDKTVAVNKDLADSREMMNQSASVYITNCSKYLESENEEMLKEIKAGIAKPERLKKITQINDVIDLGNTIRIENFKSQSTRNIKGIQQALNNFPKVFQLLHQLQKTTRQDRNIRILDEIEENVELYQEAMNSYITDWGLLQQVAKDRDEGGKNLITSCVEIADAGLSNTQQIASITYEKLNSANNLMIIGMLLALIVGVVFAMFLTKVITNPLHKGVDFANQIAKGDLSATISIEQNDEIGQLAISLRNMIAKFKEVVEGIVVGADNIAGASRQLSSGAQQISAGVSEQASSTEEVSSSMEEMASNIQQNTENARKTRDISTKASTSMEQVSNASEQSKNAVHDIFSKINVVVEIAEKTDLLAINAAVEAARAGDQGRGFAVVAAEVRKLAERSQLAANEIVELAGRGLKLTEESTEMLKAIMPDIHETSRLVDEIATASVEQESGVNQVNSALQQLSIVTQQNSSSAEEMASSSEELASQAAELEEITSYFTIDKLNQVKKKKRLETISYVPPRGIGNVKHEEKEQSAVIDLGPYKENLKDYTDM